MPDIANVLKQEIARIARKQVRLEVGSTSKAAAQHRRDIAELKRRVGSIEADIKRLLKVVAANPALKRVRLASAAPAEVEGDAGSFRFQAKGLASNRKRLGLSAADFGALIGVTGATIYSWEAGETHPRPRQLPAIAALRGIGKKQVAARLAELRGKA